MSVQETDISWSVLRRIVQNWAGAAAELTEVKPLVGGCINTTLLLQAAGGERAVLKISPHRVNRELYREAGQLTFLRSLGLPVPEVYAWHIANLDDPHSYLLMQFVEGVNLTAAKQACSPEEFDDLQRHLADLVLAMHEHTSDQYCRQAENAERFSSWPAFYRHIYDPIWHEVEKLPFLPAKSRKQIVKVHDRLERLITHGDCPRLVHWDVWSTNILAHRNDEGKWRISALLDPNCKFAHAEAEIAYMDLFHTITPVFLKAYQQKHKLSDAYHRVRKPVYQLYPMINHVRLFGQEYLKPLLGALEKVLPLV